MDLDPESLSQVEEAFISSANSHEDRRFHHFLDHCHPSVGDEILACHTAVTAVTTTNTNLLA
jgi:hypothetical protein